MKKRAVVLAGGGARGPYQIGVWKALRELAISFQIVTGTSVGALNGALMVQGDFDLAKTMWEHITTRDVIRLPDLDGLSHADKRNYLAGFLQDAVARRALDTGPLEALLREAVDEQRLRSSAIAFGLVTTQFPHMRQMPFWLEQIPQGEVVDYLLASASYFPFFGSREIGERHFIDGAFADNMPVHLALDWGAEEIIAIDLDGFGIVHPYKESVPVTHIYSHWDLGQILFFDPVRAKRNMQLGYQDGLKAFRKLEGQAYAFQPGETRNNALKLHDAFVLLRRRTGVDILHNREGLVQQAGAKRHLGKRFGGYVQGHYTLGQAICSMAEVTGFVLGVEPDNIYTFDRFNQACLAAFYSGSRPWKEAEFAAVKKLYQQLERALYHHRLPNWFDAATTLAPKSLTAAYYLLALHLTR